MEFFALLIFLAFIVLIIGSIMGFVANSRITGLEQHIKALNRRLDNLVNNEAVTQDIKQPQSSNVKAAALKTNVKAKTGPAPKREPIPTKPVQKPAPKSVSKPISKPTPNKPKRSFEEELGAKWAVWVGGLALLLGAVFLLRYTIEAGFFTPSMRIVMASLLGAGLLGGGEWLRRHDKLPISKSGKSPAILENSYIPGVLTAVGIFTLLGTVYAAYELYGFIGPISAFILMAVVSLGALTLGILHGPWISALGLVASFATPLLIQTEAPNVPALFGYLSIISLVAWTLAKFRDWGWLDLSAFAGGIFWLFMAHEATESTPHLWIWLGLFTLLFTASTYIAARPKPATFKLGDFPLVHTPQSALIVSAILAMALFGAIGKSALSLNLDAMIAVIFVTALTATAFYRPALIGNTLIAALFCAVYVAIFIPYNENGLGSYAMGPLFAIIIGGGLLQLLRQPGQVTGKFWPYLGAFFPPIILWITENTIRVNEHITPAIAFILAGLLIFASIKLRTRRDDQAHRFSTYPWAAAFAYWLGVVTLTTGVYESIGLMFGILLFALLFGRLKWISLRWISLAFAVLAMIQILFLEISSPDAMTSKIILNQLWIYFALPALICFTTARFYEKSERDLPSEALKASALIFATLFFVFQIRHAMNDGIITTGTLSFDEVALQVLTGLCFTLGGVALNIPDVKVSQKSAPKSDIYAQFIPILLRIISYLTLAVFAFGLCLTFAPLLNENMPIKGGMAFNTLILAYALPTILMGLIIWLGRGKRPEHYIKLLGGLALLGGLFYLTSQIRRIYSGPRISIFDHFPEGFETYTISASWLILGIVLLFAGIKLQSKSLRIASAVMVFLTVLKAFLIDMSTLEGVLRPISFLILGLVLTAIGWTYQKVIFKNPVSD